MREHLRAVIWPRQNAKSPSEAVDRDGKKVYRYTVVGVLVTDRELTFIDSNEVLVDGPVSLGLLLEAAPQRSPSGSLPVLGEPGRGDALEPRCSGAPVVVKRAGTDLLNHFEVVWTLTPNWKPREGPTIALLHGVADWTDGRHSLGWLNDSEWKSMEEQREAIDFLLKLGGSAYDCTVVESELSALMKNGRLFYALGYWRFVAEGLERVWWL
jgi:hypothetical protein